MVQRVRPGHQRQRAVRSGGGGADDVFVLFGGVRVDELAGLVRRVVQVFESLEAPFEALLASERLEDVLVGALVEERVRVVRQPVVAVVVVEIVRAKRENRLKLGERFRDGIGGIGGIGVVGPGVFFSFATRRAAFSRR